MSVTFVAANAMSNEPSPPGNAYADHELALEISPATVFDGAAAKPGGLFPDTPIAGVAGCDRYHVHEISFNGIVWRVSVTFLFGHGGQDHVGNAFYFPVPTRSKTFARYCTRLPANNKAARDYGDGVFDRYWTASKKLPGAQANERILAGIARDLQIAKDAEEKDKADAVLAAKAKPVVSAAVGDRKHFGQSTGGDVMTAEAAQAMIDAYLSKSKVVLANGDNRSLLVCLKEGRPKDKWLGWVQKYYDGIMA